MAIVKLNSIDEKSNIPEIIRVEYTFKYAKVFLIEIPRETKKLKIILNSLSLINPIIKQIFKILLST